MSNVYTSNPIVLDTTMANTFKNTAGAGLQPGSPVSLTQFKIKAIFWDCAGTATQTVVLTDGTNNLYSGASGAQGISPAPLVFPQAPLIAQDLKLTTLGSGKLYIYLWP